MRVSALWLILSCAVIAAPSFAAPSDPLGKIRTAYAEIARDWGKGQDPSDVTVTDRSLNREWFTDRFVEALEADAECWQDGKEGYGTIWYMGQDHDIKNLTLRAVGNSQSAPVVRAEFRNFGQRQRVDFVFKKQNRVWLIDDVMHQGESISRAMLEDCEG